MTAAYHTESIAIGQTEAARRFATVSARVGAQLLDSILAFAPVFAFSLGALLLGFEQIFTGAIGLLGAAFVVTYMAFADGMARGQSWGKRLVRIAVVDERTGHPCTYRQSIVRNLSLGLLNIVDLLCLMSKKRQRLGDILAHTVVVEVGSP